MKYAIDCEFIDTPTCSALISLAIVREDGESKYFEFRYPKEQITPWLKENVLPHLHGHPVSPYLAAKGIQEWIGSDKPEFWCYFGAYDWYWFCRLWGGFMEMPQHWPLLFWEFARIQQPLPNTAGAEHNALNDARSLMNALHVFDPPALCLAADCPALPQHGQAFCYFHQERAKLLLEDTNQ